MFYNNYYIYTCNFYDILLLWHFYSLLIYKIIVLFHDLYICNFFLMCGYDIINIVTFFESISIYGFIYYRFNKMLEDNEILKQGNEKNTYYILK